jgi:hypothetical protein
MMASKTLLRISTVLFAPCILGFGCSSKPTLPTGWSKAEIESKIKASGKFREIHLAETEGSGGGEQKSAVTQSSETRKYEGTGTGENGHTYKIKATYTYKDNGGKGWHVFHWEAEPDSQGEKMSGTYEGPGSGVIKGP